MKIQNVMAWGVFLLAGILVSVDTSDAQERTEREKTLEQQVELLLQRVEALENRLDEKEKVEANADSVPPATDPEAVTTSLKGGLQLKTQDGDFTMKIGGRLQNDWFAGSIDDGDFPDGTRFRRLWLKTLGTVYEDFNYKIQYDIAGTGNSRWKDAWIEYTALDYANVRLGLFKEPFSMEELMLNRDLTFLERAAPNTLVPSRNTGVMLHNEIPDKRVTWAAGAFKTSNSYGDGHTDDTTNGDWDVTARGTALPWYEDDGAKLIHLGAAYTHREWGDDPLRYRARGSVSRGDRLIDTGTYDVDSIDAVGAEAALVYGPLSLMSEYVHAELDASMSGSDGYDSAYGQVSYFLTGEHRPYKGGMWTRVKPKNNFDLQSGHWGAWEVAARYNYLDVSETPVASAPGGELRDIALALNLYLNPSMRAMWNYVHSETDDSDQDDFDADMVLMRVQIDFSKTHGIG